MLLVSWNVAGWAPTHRLICEHYGSLARYLELLGQPHILCIQEAKIASKDLLAIADAKSKGAVLPGYTSYWAFAEAGTDKPRAGAHAQQAGMAGVTTWIRNDVKTLCATQEVTGMEAFDRQGRCLLTDHGSFAVFNVYASYVQPNSDADAIHAKLTFLQQLEKKVEELRAAGRRVLLCGDLNLTYRPEDSLQQNRVVFIGSEGLVVGNGNTLTKDGAQPVEIPALPEWANTWRRVKEIGDRIGTAPGTELWQALVEMGTCSHWSRERACVEWFQKFLSSNEVSHRRWVDVFAEVHPTAQDRFTCFSQSGNSRFYNGGTRIDHIIVDDATFESHVIKSASSMLPGGLKDSDNMKPELEATSPQAALNAVTCYGAWHGAPRIGMAKGDGLTLQKDAMQLNNTQFPKAAFTGLIYTPPAYSDHIASSCYFGAGFLAEVEDAFAKIGQESKLLAQASIKTLQPWQGQKSLSSFFSTSSKSAARVNDTSKKSCSEALSNEQFTPWKKLRKSTEEEQMHPTREKF